MPAQIPPRAPAAGAPAARSHSAPATAVDGGARADQLQRLIELLQSGEGGVLEQPVAGARLGHNSACNSLTVLQFSDGPPITSPGVHEVGELERLAVQLLRQHVVPAEAPEPEPEPEGDSGDTPAWLVRAAEHVEQLRLQAPPSGAQPPPAVEPEPPAALPAGWVCGYSAEHGAHYYYNVELRRTQWESPIAGAAEPAAPPPAAAPPAFDSIQLSEAGSFHAWAGEAGAQQRAAAEASAAAHAAADQSLGALVQDLLRRDIEELGMYIT